jgi:hypothetical protein
MREPSSAPAAADPLFSELVGSSEPAPPARSRASRVLRMLARIALWSLIAAGALRGLIPDPPRPGPARAPAQAQAPAQSRDPAQAPARGVAAEHSGERRAQAVAAAFLREYLTVGDDRAARAERLGQFAAAGLELGGSVSVSDGVAQYADHVVPIGSSPVAGGIEVTVLAHVLQVRSGAYLDGGTLAFVVPLAARGGRVAVAGRPRPAALPIASGLSLPRPPAAPATLSQLAGRVARQAVVALLAADATTLKRLGGGRAPATRPLPSGWRARRVGHAEVTGTTRALIAQVPVRARPPAGRASYVVPVRVQLAAGPQGLAVRQIDGGGSM